MSTLGILGKKDAEALADQIHNFLSRDQYAILKGTFLSKGYLPSTADRMMRQTVLSAADELLKNEPRIKVNAENMDMIWDKILSTASAAEAYRS